jgi:ParB-like chromosome segregation protein Spo0J
MNTLNLSYGSERPVAALQPHERNPRTHPKKQIAQIADSIRRFGFTNAVLIDSENRIIAGHGRVAAAELIGLETVPVVMIEGMSEAERCAYIIADNRLAELAGWDMDLLKLELGDILTFDLALAGFDGAELEALLDISEASASDEEAPIIDDRLPVVTRRNDLW